MRQIQPILASSCGCNDDWLYFQHISSDLHDNSTTFTFWYCKSCNGGLVSRVLSDVILGKHQAYPLDVLAVSDNQQLASSNLAARLHFRYLLCRSHHQQAFTSWGSGGTVEYLVDNIYRRSVLIVPIQIKKNCSAYVEQSTGLQQTWWASNKHSNLKPNVF